MTPREIPREMVDKMHAGQPGWFQCPHCKHWYTALGLEKHEDKSADPERIKSPYNIRCLTFL